MAESNQTRNHLTIFAGAVAVTVLGFALFLGWFDWLLYPPAQTVASYASPELADGATGSGSGLAVFILFVAKCVLWVIGWLAIRACKGLWYMLIQVCIVLKSVLIGGKGWIESWQESKADDQELDNTPDNQLLHQSVQRSGGNRVGTTEAEREPAGQTGQASAEIEARLAKTEKKLKECRLVTRWLQEHVTEHNELSDALKSAPSFAAFKRSIKKETEDKSE